VDVCVSDIRMPGMSGIEVLDRLRFVDPKIEVVMITAFETNDTLRQALKLNACDYVNKPFDIATIRTAVANALQRRRLKDNEADAEQKFQTLFAELQQQKMQEQITHARGEIYGQILHDIKSPLAVIGGFAQLIQQRLDDHEPTAEDIHFIRDKIKVIIRQTASCNNLTERYLGFLRQAEGVEGVRVPVDSLLMDLRQLVAGHPSLGENTLNIEPLEAEVAARMNGTDLIQILRNLVINGLQASSAPHTVHVTGCVLAEPVDLLQFRDGPADRVMNLETFENVAPLLKLTVRDDGPGVPPEIMPKIFQTYFTTKPVNKGTGLGLSIIMRLIKQAGGLLHLRSSLGAGAAFTIYLPAAK
jgi:signal transduction histidine kinase